MINYRPIWRATLLDLGNTSSKVSVLVFLLIMLVIVVTLYPKNLLSATTYPKAVDEKLAKEIQLGRIVGPFDGQPFPVFHVSPLGLIPKKVPGEFRLIHHLSFSEGKSINSHIPQIASSVHYANIDDAIRLIRRTARGCALAKTDIKNAFRLIPVSPSDYNFLGI